MFSGQLQTSPINQTGNLKNTKALQYARLPGSLTLEAALVTPLLLFFVLLFLYHIAKLTLFIIPMEEPYVPLFQHAASVHLPLLSDFCPQTAPYLLLQ